MWLQGGRRAWRTAPWVPSRSAHDKVMWVWKIWRKTNPWRWRKYRQKSVMLTRILLYLFLWPMLLSILFKRRKWDRILKQKKRYLYSGQERKPCSPLNKYVGINHPSLFFNGFLVLARWHLELLLPFSSLRTKPHTLWTLNFQKGHSMLKWIILR